MRVEVKNILLVDDDPDDCFLFRKALAEVDAAYQLQFLSDTDDLVPTLTHHRPDMLFLDINMPKRSGFDCIQELKALPNAQGLPIVMYSCSEQASFITSAYENGAHLYLCKPASNNALVVALKKILSLDWSEPQKIAAQYLKAGHYHPFEEA